MIKRSIRNLAINTYICRQLRGIRYTPITGTERANVNNGVASIRRWRGKIGVIFNWGVTRARKLHSRLTFRRGVLKSMKAVIRWCSDRYIFFPPLMRRAFVPCGKTHVTPTKRRRHRYRWRHRYFPLIVGHVDAEAPAGGYSSSLRRLPFCRIVDFVKVSAKVLRNDRMHGWTKFNAIFTVA